MKVIVYAICKNEEKHIKRWVESMKEADDIYVLDTGSTDNSVKLLKSLNVHVKEKKYKLFKFDQARNDSLDLLPSDTDICVCTDIDEVLNKNWRKELERIWKSNTDRVKYNLNFSFNSKNEPVMSYYISKIHTRDNYRWKNKVHEVLEFTLNREENVIESNIICINHYPDRTKNRDFYLDLLEQSVKENPTDERNLHYLGREYMYKGEYNKSIDTLIKHINVSTWDEEKSSSCRYISYCYSMLNRDFEREMWIKESIKITPNVKEGYVLLGILYYEQKKYNSAIDALLKADEIKQKSTTYINEEYAWNETTYDILSLCYYYTCDIEKSLYYSKKAHEMNPTDERIKNNYEIFKNMINNLH